MVTKTIGATGRDYSDLSAWEAVLDDSGVYTAGQEAVGEMYDDADFTGAGDADITINGGATLGVSEVILRGASGERHTGKAGTGVVVVKDANAQKIFVATPNTFDNKYTLEWIEFDGAGFQDEILDCLSQDFQDVAIVKNCILHDINGGNAFKGCISAASRDVLVMNNIAYDVTRNGSSDVHIFDLDADRASGGSFNNTLYKTSNPGAGSNVGLGMVTNSANHKSRNNISMGNAVDFTYGGTSINDDYNLSEDDSADDGGGSNHRIGSTHGQADTDMFVSVTNGSEDLRLKTGADAIDKGEDQVTTPSGVEVDINGRDRDASGDTWDIGAHELVAAGGATPKGVFGLPLHGPLAGPI